MARAGEVTPVEKANLSFVTDLDRDLEQMIRRRLGERFPDDQITGEEYAAEGGSGPRRWSIDPIDGTGNLVHGLPLWAISIGLIDRGEPVLGVIAIPPLGELYWAVKGQGAWRDGQRLQARDADDDPQPGQHLHRHQCLAGHRSAVGCPDGSATWELPVASRCSWRPAGFRLARSSARRPTTSPRAWSFPARPGARSARWAASGSAPPRWSAARPSPHPTFVAPPRRLATLMRLARPLPPRIES